MGKNSDFAKAWAEYGASLVGWKRAAQEEARRTMGYAVEHAFSCGFDAGLGAGSANSGSSAAEIAEQCAFLVENCQSMDPSAISSVVNGALRAAAERIRSTFKGEGK